MNKNKVGGLTGSDFKTYYKTIVIKTVQSWRKAPYTDKWKRTENPEIEPQYDQLMPERSQHASVEKVLSFQQIVLEKVTIPMFKK